MKKPRTRKAFYLPEFFYLMIDVLVVGIIVAAAIVALVVIIVRSIVEKAEYGSKQQKLFEEVRRVESSSLIG